MSLSQDSAPNSTGIYLLRGGWCALDTGQKALYRARMRQDDKENQMAKAASSEDTMGKRILFAHQKQSSPMIVKVEFVVLPALAFPKKELGDTVRHVPPLFTSKETIDVLLLYPL
ncbi:hypothetical protein S7711_11227 [Stachybotrys chartarum IBT 7711]|uniref:Uncharacterized protein n=1 Tax=Stachybotrys chartarum (strain CBS 109288 / IBT 7711) TaxID=1280523 RepID=A0A084AI44_STACB|nr:hypothetical protein S7711_11227 [Stachybotrys chartarum IBT 7711]KFA51824.1 hypothetical protein S40293_11001 [Stachybotrys chartarum IBT 40293]KFA79667.1 hypothetical protein S40288_10870 [Stachybotrys chartarum IBT 40288]